MTVKLTPGLSLTKSACVVKTQNGTVGVLDDNFNVVETGLSFDGTTITQALKAYFNAMDKEFTPQAEPIIRFVKTDNCSNFEHDKYSGMTIAAKIDYDNGTMSYGWAVALYSDGFNKGIGKQIALDRLEKNPVVVGYDPEYGVFDNVGRGFEHAPHQVKNFLYNLYY